MIGDRLPSSVGKSFSELQSTWNRLLSELRKTPTLTRGSLAGRPEASRKDGEFYFATDTKELFLSDNGEWVKV